MKHSKKVYLEPISHTYIHIDGLYQYKSVSHLLSLYKNKFDAQNISKRVAKRRGLTQDEVLQEWQDINTTATTYGSKIHDNLEQWIKMNGFYFSQDEELKKVFKSAREIGVLSAENILAEEILHMDDLGIAGTSDLIHDHGNYFNILDYKTNKKLDFINQYGDWMKPPLQHLSDCSYNHYALQLSIYAYMYNRQTGKPLGSLTILWWDRDKQEFIRYPVPYLKYEVEELLKHYSLYHGKKD